LVYHFILRTYIDGISEEGAEENISM